ncbi:MAG: alpha/beta fold hydrolase [Alphaproteobacteria bacterium]|nr:alpha/beta fold hydrolase [Alphaproteobacteria bacterium]
MLALSAACAPTVQAQMIAPAAFDGPRFEDDRYIAFDGAALGLQTWLPESQSPWGVLVALHGMNDYSEAFYLAGPYWAERGVAVYAYDARGHGRSPQRGVWGGRDLMTEDARTAVRIARARHPGAVVGVIGESMGAATAIAAFGDGEPAPLDRIILSAPAVWGWSSLPDVYAVTLWLGAHTFPFRNVTPPRGLNITPTDNVEALRKMGRDRLMIFSTRVDAVYGMVNLMETAAQSASALTAPTLFLYGGRDQIIPRPAALATARRLPSAARTAFYPGGYHLLLRDQGRAAVFDDVLAFLRDPAAPLPSDAAPLLSVPDR